MHVPLGVFNDLIGALGWIDLQSGDYSVAQYPVGISLFEAAGEIAAADPDPASFTCPPSPISRIPIHVRNSRLGNPVQRGKTYFGSGYPTCLIGDPFQVLCSPHWKPQGTS